MSVVESEAKKPAVFSWSFVTVGDKWEICLDGDSVRSSANWKNGVVTQHTPNCVTIAYWKSSFKRRTMTMDYATFSRMHTENALVVHSRRVRHLLPVYPQWIVAQDYYFVQICKWKTVGSASDGSLTRRHFDYQWILCKCVRFRDNKHIEFYYPKQSVTQRRCPFEKRLHLQRQATQARLPPKCKTGEHEGETKGAKEEKDEKEQQKESKGKMYYNRDGNVLTIEDRAFTANSQANYNFIKIYPNRQNGNFVLSRVAADGVTRTEKQKGRRRNTPLMVYFDGKTKTQYAIMPFVNEKQDSGESHGCLSVDKSVVRSDGYLYKSNEASLKGPRAQKIGKIFCLPNFETKYETIYHSILNIPYLARWMPNDVIIMIIDYVISIKAESSDHDDGDDIDSIICDGKRNGSGNGNRSNGKQRSHRARPNVEQEPVLDWALGPYYLTHYTKSAYGKKFNNDSTFNKYTNEGQFKYILNPLCSPLLSLNKSKCNMFESWIANDTFIIGCQFTIKKIQMNKNIFLDKIYLHNNMGSVQLKCHFSCFDLVDAGPRPNDKNKKKNESNGNFRLSLVYHNVFEQDNNNGGWYDNQKNQMTDVTVGQYMSDKYLYRIGFWISDNVPLYQWYPIINDGFIDMLYAASIGQHINDAPKTKIQTKRKSKISRDAPIGSMKATMEGKFRDKAYMRKKLRETSFFNHLKWAKFTMSKKIGLQELREIHKQDVNWIPKVSFKFKQQRESGKSNV